MINSNRLCAVILLLVASSVNASSQLWQEVPPLPTHDENVTQARSSAVIPAQGTILAARQYQVDDLELRASLQRVTTEIGPGSQQVIRLPMPDGSLADFEIYESPIMEDKLAQKYPEIRTFQVYGIDDPQASGRLDISPSGFHAMLNTSQGRLFIDPDSRTQQADRYLARNFNANPSPGYSCGVDELDFPAQPASSVAARAAARSSNKLRKYRIAVAATDDYVEEIYNPAAPGGRRSQAQAAIVTAINRVNDIYQRDVGVFLRLVNDNDDLIEINGNAGFSDGNPQALFNQNQAWIDATLGNSRYDVGHVFSTGGGGLAWLGGACDNPNKARGVSGITNPVGDPFYIDFVAHEIGHQFNAEHSFNGSTQSCGIARSADYAYEPGSGSTIMAYAGICGVEDLQVNSDATFHAGSIKTINNFVSSAGGCYKTINATPANPNHPVINALANKSIPDRTPFVLDGTATDADGDTLSYQWDQMNAGCATDASSFGTDTGSNALFRSYEPRSVSARHFPALGTQLQGLYDDAEVLPCQKRDLNFRLTVRDGLSGQDARNLKVSVVKRGSRFRITSLDAGVDDLNTPGQTLATTTPVSVKWNVAKTDRSPVSCANVDIELMTFAPAYATYSVHPLSVTTTPNDGSAMVSVVPATNSHPRARIRIKCSDNIFYDISDADFAITGTEVLHLTIPWWKRFSTPMAPRERVPRPAESQSNAR